MRRKLRRESPSQKRRAGPGMMSTPHSYKVPPPRHKPPVPPSGGIRRTPDIRAAAAQFFTQPRGDPSPFLAALTIP